MSPPERLTLFLDDRDNRSLSAARIKDGLPAADRIRAAVLLWQQRTLVTEQINDHADELRRARLARIAVAAERKIKVSVILGETTHRALALARVEDGIPASERVRAALHQWQRDPEFRAAVDDLAAQLRRQRFADRAAADPAGTPAAITPDLARPAS